MAVGIQHPVGAGEGAHQHQQGGFRQVKIGEQRIHDPETVAGVDEDIGLALERRDTAVTRRRLQGAHNRRADGHHASAVRALPYSPARPRPRPTCSHSGCMRC